MFIDYKKVWALMSMGLFNGTELNPHTHSLGVGWGSTFKFQIGTIFFQALSETFFQFITGHTL